VASQVKDAIGRPIYLGDLVAVATSGGSNGAWQRICEVVGFDDGRAVLKKVWEDGWWDESKCRPYVHRARGRFLKMHELSKEQLPGPK
jgi:hypothetical protein